MLNTDASAIRIESAKDTLKPLTVKALKHDPGLAFQQDSIQAFIALQSLAPDEWARWKAHLKKAGVSLRDLDRQMNSTRAKLRVVEPGAKAERTVRSMLGTGCPVSTLVVPHPYRLTREGTRELKCDDEESQEVDVAFAPVLITRRLRDDETGRQSLEVAWWRQGKWQRLVRDRGVVMDPKKLLSLASLGFPVAGDNAAALSGYLHKFEAENYASLPCAVTSSHLGWQGVDGKAGFLWGRTMIGPNGKDTASIQFYGSAEGDEQLADGYHNAGRFDAWLDGIRHICGYARVLIVFYAAFVPVLLHILGAPNFVLDLCGGTTTGKTTSLRVAASVWGCPDELRPHAAIHTWDITQVWVERAAAVLSGLPLILDETKRARNPQIIHEMIYTVVGGQGRGRGNVEGLSRTQSWNTVLISSGEAPATSYSQAGGTRTRCLELRGLPFGAQDEAAGLLARDLNTAVNSNYGHAGPRFVRYWLTHRDEWEQFRRYYLEDIKRYRDLAPGCPEADRLAQCLAGLSTAVLMVHGALDLPWDHSVGMAALDELWPDIAGEAEDAAGADRALRDVVAWAHANEARFPGRATGQAQPPGGWAGRWDSTPDWDFIAFFQPVLRDVLQKSRYEPEAILHEWKGRGWLDTRADRKTGYTKQVAFQDRKPHMVVIRRQPVDDVDAAS